MSADELARELGGIEAACRRLGHTDGLDAARPVCLYRRVGGLSAEAWRRLKKELELDAWDVATPEVLVTDPGSRLRRFLHREMDRAKQCQLPLALAFIEPDANDAADSVFDLVLAQLRSFDHASRQEGGVIAVVLSAMPLAAAERLIGAMLRRIRQVCEPALVCSAGLIGYGGLAQLSPEALLLSAGKALEDARRLGGNRLEVAPSADAALASRETLVRASEKHFLFTGRKLPESQDHE